MLNTQTDSAVAAFVTIATIVLILCAPAIVWAVWTAAL